MEKSLVSTIIPCYKQARYLPQAVESVLAQTYPNLEVIVVNDGSPDNTEEVMRAYADDPRVRLITQSNQGLAAARNRGIAAARGAYLQFLDADDWLHPTKVARQVEILEADSTVGLVYSDFFTVDAENKIVPEIIALPPLLPGEPDVFALLPLEPDIFGTLWSGNCIAYLSALVREDWISRIGGFDATVDMDGLGFEDYELWMRLAASGCRVRYMPERLAYYRRHSTNRSGGAMDEVWMDLARKAIARRFPDKVAVASEFAFGVWKHHARDLHYWAEAALQEKAGAIAELTTKVESTAHANARLRTTVRRRTRRLYKARKDLKHQTQVAAEMAQQMAALRTERDNLARVLNSYLMRKIWKLLRTYWALRSQGPPG